MNDGNELAGVSSPPVLVVHNLTGSEATKAVVHVMIRARLISRLRKN